MTHARARITLPLISARSLVLPVARRAHTHTRGGGGASASASASDEPPLTSLESQKLASHLWLAYLRGRLTLGSGGRPKFIHGNL